MVKACFLYDDTGIVYVNGTVDDQLWLHDWKVSRNDGRVMAHGSIRLDTCLIVANSQVTARLTFFVSCEEQSIFDMCRGANPNLYDNVYTIIFSPTNICNDDSLANKGTRSNAVARNVHSIIQHEYPTVTTQS